MTAQVSAGLFQQSTIYNLFLFTPYIQWCAFHFHTQFFKNLASGTVLQPMPWNATQLTYGLVIFNKSWCERNNDPPHNVINHSINGKTELHISHYQGCNYSRDNWRGTGISSIPKQKIEHISATPTFCQLKGGRIDGGDCSTARNNSEAALFPSQLAVSWQAQHQRLLHSWVILCAAAAPTWGRLQ